MSASIIRPNRTFTGRDFATLQAAHTTIWTA